MNTQNNSQGRTLPKRNVRWKWMAGATAATAATATAAQAGIVQINLVGNTISSGTGASQLNGDLTGVGHAQLGFHSTAGRIKPVNETDVISGQFVGVKLQNLLPGWRLGTNAGVPVIGPGGSSSKATSFSGDFVLPYARWRKFDYGSVYTVATAAVILGGGTVGAGRNAGPAEAEELVPIIFTDPKINGGLPTHGKLEVLSIAGGGLSATVNLTRLVFDDANRFNSLSTVTATGTYPSIGSTQAGVFTPVPTASAQITSPASGSTFTSTSGTFTWSHGHGSHQIIG